MSFEVEERIPVPFKGEGSGTGELTWTQQAIWIDMQRAGISLAMTAVRDLGPDPSLEELIDEYGFYLSRYQAMRTLLRFEPDGRPVQVVHDSGMAEIKIYDAGEREPRDFAVDLAGSYSYRSFDYEREWPMQMLLVRSGGELTHAIVAIAHHMADASAAVAMFEDLRDRDPVTGVPPRPPGIQPLEQTALQQTPAARRQNEAALRYWEEQLRVIPPSMFSRGATPDPQGRCWHVDFASPAMYYALRAIAARLGVNTGPVLYAIFATALAEVTGVNPVATMITVNNRFRPGLANAAGHMVQHGLCTLDVKGAGFAELVHKARRRLLVAQKHGYFVQSDVDALVERVGRERGVTFDLHCLFNDRRVADSPIRTDEPPQTAPPAYVWRVVGEMHHHRMIFHANDGDRTLKAQVQIDTAYLGRAEVTALLERMEKVAAAAARQETER